MKTQNMPITKALLFFSWATVVLGVITIPWVVLAQGVTIKTFAIGLWGLIGSFSMAAILRSFAKVGQLIFELKNDWSIAFHKGFLKAQERDQTLACLQSDLHQMKDVVKQIDCDAKDMNQNIEQIKDFFSKMKHHIESHQ
jgi:hypothetical protein